jgi:hypothetical protein
MDDFDESRIMDMIDDVDTLMDMAPECTGFMVPLHFSANLRIELWTRVLVQCLLIELIHRSV